MGPRLCLAIRPEDASDALDGVRKLLLKQKAKLFFCREPKQTFKRVLSDIGAWIEFARKQATLPYQGNLSARQVLPPQGAPRVQTGSRGHSP